MSSITLDFDSHVMKLDHCSSPLMMIRVSVISFWIQYPPQIRINPQFRNSNESKEVSIVLLPSNSGYLFSLAGYSACSASRCGMCWTHGSGAASTHKYSCAALISLVMSGTISITKRVEFGLPRRDVRYPHCHCPILLYMLDHFNQLRYSFYYIFSQFYFLGCPQH